MKSLYEKFYHALAWSSIESICYHSVLFGHQVTLFYVVGSDFYGVIGSIFSFIYLSIALSNFGLDDSIAPFFSLSTASKAHFQRLLLPQLIPESIILVVLALSIVVGGPHLPYFFAKGHTDRIPFLIIGGIIVCEGLKKTLRLLLQIAFLSKPVACIELLAVLTYVTIVWGLYGCGLPLTLSLLLFPLFLTSCVGSLALGYAVYVFYKKLPETSDDPIACTIPRRILKNRFFSYLIHINHQFFSGNFLVPIFALRFGFGQAGILKLTSHGVHTISAIIHKAFGPTSFALLAHHKNMDITEKRTAFYTATGSIHQVIYSIFIFLAINYKKLLTRYPSDSPEIYWPLIIFFIIVHFSEHFFSTYEKFYLTEEKIEYIFFLNCLTTFFIYATIYHQLSFTPFTIFALIFLIRMGSFGIIHFLSFKLWRLKPNFRIHPVHLFASLIFSIVVFIMI